MPRVAHGEIRQKILEAAEERLWHYGFKKTTIDEIAADAGVGKGTVYLYFDSKEDIALAIMTQFKRNNLEQIRTVVRDAAIQPLNKLKEVMTLPARTAYQRCSQSPAAQELVVAVRPHIQVRMRPYLEEEVELIAEVLDEGNRTGVFSVSDTRSVARTLKAMCAGFWPPYPYAEGTDAIGLEIGRIVDLVFTGLRPNDLQTLTSEGQT